MATDYFLKIDGIEGESTDSKHKGEIDLFSFSWGASNPVVLSTGGGATSGKVQFSDFSFMMRTSKASPTLMLACASGEHIKEAVLTGQKSGTSQFEFMKITLTDILVSSFQESGSAGGDLPTESLSLNFAKIQFSYTEQLANGAAGQTYTATWDLRQNKAV